MTKKIKMNLALDFGDFEGKFKLDSDKGGEIVCDNAIVIFQRKEKPAIIQNLMAICGDTEKMMKSDDIIQALVMTIKAISEKREIDPLMRAFCDLVFNAYMEAIEIQEIMEKLSKADPEEGLKLIKEKLGDLKKDKGLIKDFDNDDGKWN